MLQTYPQNSKSKPFIVICGPTASGKSALALSFAQRYGGHIINADSRQIFQDLPILSASPSEEDFQSIPHKLYHILPWESAPFNAALWAELASQEIENCAQQNKVPIVVGGTGFYIQTLLEGIPNIPTPPRYHTLIHKLLALPGFSALAHHFLKSWDPNLTFHKNNTAALMRAVSIAISTGKKPSSLKNAPKRYFTQRPSILIAITPQKHLLDHRIAQRANIMFESGVRDEVRSFTKHKRYQPNLIGFQECLDVDKNLISEKKAIERIVISTRQYAKRQLTFARGQMRPDIIWPHIFDQSQWEKINEEILKYWCHRGGLNS